MSQLVFSTIPETYAMAGLSVILSFTLLAVSLKQRQLMFPLWVVVGVISFGLLITNVLQTLICFVIAVRGVIPREDRRSQVLAFSILMAIGAVGLAILQRLIFPGAELFFVPTAMLTSTEYIGVNSLGAWRIVSEIWSNMGFLSIVGCTPTVITEPSGIQSLTYFGGWHAGVLAVFCGVTLCGLFLVSLRSWWTELSDRPFAAALILGFGVNVVIHLFYGTNELFLYSCNYTFPVVALVVFAPAARHLWYRIGLTILTCLLIINNFSTLHLLLSMIR
jgi:hypothetical protein